MLIVLGLRKLCQNLVRSFELWVGKITVVKSQKSQSASSFPVLARKIASTFCTWNLNKHTRSETFRTVYYNACNTEFTQTQQLSTCQSQDTTPWTTATPKTLQFSKTLSSQHMSAINNLFPGAFHVGFLPIYFTSS